MGIGEPHRGGLAFTLFDLATPWLGDASTQATPSPRRRLRLGDASSWRLYIWATPRADFDLPFVDFDLDLANALIRDGTQAP